MPTKLRTLFAALLLLPVAGCADDADDPAYAEHTAPNGDRFNDADVRFASEMTQHHAQALLLVDLTLGRPLDAGTRELTEEIRAVQAPEIEQLTTWLTDWGRPVPETVRDHVNAHGDGQGAAPDLPGMAGQQDLADLEAATDDRFTVLWLELMAEHHEGAIEIAEDQRADGLSQPVVDLAETIETARTEELRRIEQLLER
jgi:uncharacterized protein (DUF305 family)